DFYKAVLWAVENNVTYGTSETKFSPANTCTRAQVVTFLYRAAQLLDPEPAPDPDPEPNPENP
ncbi:MAG: S-layer homology domain-containing protein, partial [Bacteroidales bacterium]|nr:S-layer homology domain-containing protein [Bacteroidales bacterium]